MNTEERAILLDRIAKEKIAATLNKNGSLYDWCQKNGEYGQQLLNEYVDEHIDIKNIQCKSTKKVKWKCSRCNKEWEATVYNRTERRTGCKECKGTLRSDTGMSLYDWCIRNGDFGQLLLDEYSDDNIFKIKEISCSSNKKVTWICKVHKHRWEVSPNQRTFYHTYCPFCSGHNISETNSLYNWCKNNEYGKTLINEWDKCNIDMKNVFKRSGNKYWWTCSKCKYRWQATVNNRVTRHTGCPKCNSNNDSFPERFLADELEKLYSTVKRRVRFSPNVDIRCREIDIYIEDIGLAIEYNGYTFHRKLRDCSESEHEKYEICKKHNILLIHVFDWYEYDELDDRVHIINDSIHVNICYGNREREESQLRDVLEAIDYIYNKYKRQGEV